MTESLLTYWNALYALHLDCISGELNNRQQNIADDQTNDIVGLTTPVQDMMVGWQQESSRKCCNQKYNRY